MKKWKSEAFFQFSLILLLQAFLSTLSIFVMKKWQSEACHVQQDASYQSKVVSNQSDLVRLKRSQKCHSEMSSSQNSIFPFICIAYTPDFRAILGTFLLAQRDTNACTRLAGCQLSVKSCFKSIGPWKVEEASEMSLRNVISKFHILIHLYCLHTWF